MNLLRLLLFFTTTLTVAGTPFPEVEKKIAALPLPEKVVSPADAESFTKTLIRQTQTAFQSDSTTIEVQHREVLSADGALKMPYALQTAGKKPAKGWPLIISLHGGGTAPKQINDAQWENQKRRYGAVLKNCKYLTPRAPRDREPWHPYVFPLFEKLITQMIWLESVDPDRVYLMGYSEGGYSCFRVIPALLDRLAGLAPGGAADELPLAPPENLSAVLFDLQVGELDKGYNRIGLAHQWNEALIPLHHRYPNAYRFRFKAHTGAPHDCPDYKPENAVIPWFLTQPPRNPQPSFLRWNQGRWKPAEHFYWLRTDAPCNDFKINAEIKENTVILESEDYSEIFVRLNDRMVNLDEAVTFMANGQKIFSGKLKRSAKTMRRTFLEKLDPGQIYSCEVKVPIPKRQVKVTP